MSDQAVVEILMPTGNGGFPQFTVNNGVPEVAAVYSPSSEFDSTLYNAGGSSKFVQGDSFTILSFGLVMPLSFQVGRRVFTGLLPYVSFSMGAQGLTSGVGYSFKEFGNYDKMLYVMENYDTPLDLFIDVTNQTPVSGHNLKSEGFQLWLGVASVAYGTMFISMTGVPATLNSTVQLITPYIKILHNFPLTI